MVCASITSQEYGLNRTRSGLSQKSHGSTKKQNLLFGEIVLDGESTQSNSICNLVLTTSSAFLRFWLNDKLRAKTLSHIPASTLPAVRLTCRDFAERAAPALFKSASLTFRPSSLTRPARIAALERIGHHVETFTFRFPHTSDTFLPPLVDPNTGAERPLCYRPQARSPETLAGHVRQPKYGSWELTELLIRQYPPLFHAATNVPAFVRALEAVPNMRCLKVECPGQEAANRFRRSVVDYALISLRTAAETIELPALEELVLGGPMHPAGLLYLSPSEAAGFGADEMAMKRWKAITKLSIELQSFGDAVAPDHLKFLHAYLRQFAGQLTHFKFRWGCSGDGKLKSKSKGVGKGIGVCAGKGSAGPCPLTLDSRPELLSEMLESPACYHSQQHARHAQRQHSPTAKRPMKKNSEPQILPDKLSVSPIRNMQANPTGKLPPTPPATPPRSPKLGASFDGRTDTTPTVNVITTPRKLSTPPPPPTPPKALEFPVLTHLQLDQCIADASALRTFFAKHAKKLQAADFDNIRLHGGDWNDATAPLLRGKGKKGGAKATVQPDQDGPDEQRGGGRQGGRRTPILSLACSTTTMEVPIMLRLGTPDMSSAAMWQATSLPPLHPEAHFQPATAPPMPKLQPAFDSAISLGDDGELQKPPRLRIDTRVESSGEQQPVMMQASLEGFLAPPALKSHTLPSAHPHPTLPTQHPTAAKSQPRTIPPSHSPNKTNCDNHHIITANASNVYILPPLPSHPMAQTTPTRQPINTSTAQHIRLQQSQLPAPPHPQPALISVMPALATAATVNATATLFPTVNTAVPHTVLPPLQRTRSTKQRHVREDAHVASDGLRGEQSHHGGRWLRRAKAPLVGCEGHVKRFIRGAVLAWR